MAIDIAFGTAKLEYNDIIIPGKIPLVWDRRYSTALIDRAATALGLGWTSRYFTTLDYRSGEFLFTTPEGAIEVLPNQDGAFAKGLKIPYYSASLELFRDGGRAIIQRWDLETGVTSRYCFTPREFRKPWVLDAIEDVSGEAICVRWDNNGRLESVLQRREGRALHFEHNDDGLIERVILFACGQRSVLAQYRYSCSGQLLEARDAAGVGNYYDYDSQSRLQREIGKDGLIFRYRYDRLGRCVLRSGVVGYNERRLRYLESSRTTEVSDSYGRQYVYKYLPSGQITLQVDPLGGERRTDYDEHGRIISQTDANGATTLYEYDIQGNRSSITDALGAKTAFTFNEYHQALSVIDAAGRGWRRQYDRANRVSAVINPLGNCWTYSYDPTGDLSNIVDPRGLRKAFTYKDGLLVSVTDWNGNRTEFSYDAFGRVTHRAGPLGETYHYQHDAVGNLTSIRLPDGATTVAGYDAAGNLIQLVTPNNQVTLWRYGPCMRLCERIGPLGTRIQYVWGNEPNMLEQIINEKGEVCSFFRDDCGRVVKEVAFDGSERTFGYDPDGYLTSFTNGAGETLKYNRDLLHRVVELQLSSGEAESFVFDTLGNMASASNQYIDVYWERDDVGRVVKEVQGNDWVRSEYDPAGHLIKTETSCGDLVSYSVDGNGHVFGIQCPRGESLNFQRDHYGNEISRRMRDGAELAQKYDIAGRLVGQRLAVSADSGFDARIEVASRTFSYDPCGSLLVINDSRMGRTEYGYDLAEQLVSARRDQGDSERFAYDNAGNIVSYRSESDGAGTDELVYGSGNLLLRKGDIIYEYDAEGRRIRKTKGEGGSRKVWSYEWDARNRLVAVTQPDGGVWHYQYDALGRRVAKCEQDGTGKGFRKFLWDGDVIVSDTDGGKQIYNWIFERGSYAPIATIQDEQLYSFINDHIGTPQYAIDSAGSFIWSAVARSWGGDRKIAGRPSRIACQLGFQGQWRDDESGLDYNLYRYYDSEAMRYISRDPLGLLGGINPYRYTLNPINWIDPLGLIEKGDPLPPGTVVNRIGGGSPGNLELKPAERKLDPPGISTQSGNTPQEAADAMRAAFPKATALQALSDTTGTTTSDAIRAAGFDVIHDPTGKFPNHARITHPEGEAGFDDEENRKKLSAAITDISTCKGAG